MTAILAAIGAFLTDLPIISGMFKTVVSWFTKTQAQQQATTTQQQQTEEQKMKDTGRPTWN